jgi:uncharacterized linocin/CFP29 family protein
MPAPGREIVGWTDEHWQVVQKAVQKALAGTAKCRQAVPKGPDMIGQKSLVVPNVGAGVVPIAYGADTIATPIQIYVDVTLDDYHAESEADLIRLMSAAAAQLGMLEDQEIVQGAGPPPPPPPPAGSGRVARQLGLARAAAATAAGAGAAIGAAVPGSPPSGDELYRAVATAVVNLEIAGRPGPCALLLHNILMATLRQPRFAGGVPLIQELESLIGSSKIAGTSALDGTFVVGRIGAILFRLEPAAMEIVHTQLPTVTVLERAAGSTDLRVEEDIVLRILDSAAVQPIPY